MSSHNTLWVNFAYDPAFRPGVHPDPWKAWVGELSHSTTSALKRQSEQNSDAHGKGVSLMLNLLHSSTVHVVTNMYFSDHPSKKTSANVWPS